MSPLSLASIGTALLSFALSLWLLLTSGQTQSLQREMQEAQKALAANQQAVGTQQQRLQVQQEQIQSANVLSQQVGPQVLQDLARRAVQNKNDKLRDLLAKYNLSIQENAPAASSSAPAGTPALR